MIKLRPRAGFSAIVLLTAASCASPTADPLALTAKVTLSIGAFDDDRYAFSRIEGITVGPGGHIFVLQHEDANVREYDSTGAFVRFIGKRGMGPGEFSLPTKMWWSDGSLWVADGNLMRATRFERSGVAVETQAMAAPGLGFSLQNADLLRDGSLLGQEQFVPGHPRFDRDSTPLVRVRGSVVDTILWLNVRNFAAFVGDPAKKRFFTMRHPFADYDVYRIAPTRDTIVVTRRNVRSQPGRAELLWFDLNGIQLRRRQFNLAPVPIPGAVRDSVIDFFAGAITRSGIAPTMTVGREITRRSLTLPQDYPPFGEVLLAADGSIWVCRGQSQSTDLWLIIGTTGQPLARVTVPLGLRLLYIAPPHAWAVQTNELGVPAVVRLTVQ
ncbi:MAG: 6-bladed beta-propeller [Longimicrobiales bacterium]